jgi:hypothetical protein
MPLVERARMCGRHVRGLPEPADYLPKLAGWLDIMVTRRREAGRKHPAECRGNDEYRDPGLDPADAAQADRPIKDVDRGQACGEQQERKQDSDTAAKRQLRGHPDGPYPTRGRAPAGMVRPASLRRRRRGPWPVPSAAAVLHGPRAEGEIRTRTPLRAADFKSAASALPPLRRRQRTGTPQPGSTATPPSWQRDRTSGGLQSSRATLPGHGDGSH